MITHVEFEFHEDGEDQIGSHWTVRVRGRQDDGGVCQISSFSSAYALERRIDLRHMPMLKRVATEAVSRFMLNDDPFAEETVQAVRDLIS